MNEIQKLLAQYIPSNVPFKKLGDLEDLGVLKLGRGKVISKRDLAEFPGDFPVYSSSAKGSGEFGRYGKFMFEDERISWSIDGGGRFFHRNNLKYSVTNVCGWLKVEDQEVLNTRFLFHVLTEAWENKIFDYTKKAHPSVIREEYFIPILPIEEQEEIVRILDTFVELTTELITELTIELNTRKKQYNYYRDQLLKFEEAEVEWKAFADIGDFIRGRRFTKADYVDNDGIPVLHYGEIYTQFGTSTTQTLSQVRLDLAESLKYIEPGDVVFTDVGETVDEVGKAVAWLGNEKVAIHDHCYALRHTMNPKYISYCMQTADFIAAKAKYIVRTKINTLLVKGFSKVKIPIPFPNDLNKSLVEQERIVSILDKLGNCTDSITENFPREIALREKQFKYYRELLLSFPKKEQETV